MRKWVRPITPMQVKVIGMLRGLGELIDSSCYSVVSLLW